jgi:hypothetical protein
MSKDWYCINDGLCQKRGKEQCEYCAWFEEQEKRRHPGGETNSGVMQCKNEPDLSYSLK